MPLRPADASRPGPTPVPAGGSSGSAVTGGPAAGHWAAFDLEELRRAKAGDADALGRFFDHHFDRIFSVVQRFVGNREVAEDITQDIFFKVRRHIARLDLERDPAPWLYTVAVNACRDHQRSSWWRAWRRSVPLDSSSELHESVGEAGDPERVFAAARAEHRVQAAIQKLPADLRMSLILHDFEGLPHDRIAQVMGISHAAARKRYSRALNALAVLLGKDGSP